MPTKGEKYQHFKSEEMKYEIVEITQDPKTPKNKTVVYKQLYETKDFPIGTIWTREYKEFTGYKKLPSGEEVKRFIKIQVPQKRQEFKDKFPQHK
ncbi:MAG: DUF1653 domain-containing protein [Nanoarchaeota archaeon]|jgi:hypothetical protein|nr:DUF1653 domain-containing protein [Nanoarchaeota archaeon]